MRFALSLSIVCTLLGAPRAEAQDLGEQRVATSMLTFVKIGLGARAVAMGEAFVPVADDATTMYWNPAGLALLEARHLHVSHTEWPADIDYDPQQPFAGLTQPGGQFLAAYCDGSCRELSARIGADLMRALVTPNGGERVESDQLR